LNDPYKDLQENKKNDNLAGSYNICWVGGVASDAS
jgi:hypothetical protein